jgi:hypothetical protein
MADDTFEAAIRTSIKNYFKGIEPEKSYKTSEGRVKYNKKFFDKAEEERTKGPTMKSLVEKGQWS